jgi:hypothetical protein
MTPMIEKLRYLLRHARDVGTGGEARPQQKYHDHANNGHCAILAKE